MMPYTVRKQKCKKSDGGSGSYVLSYTDKKGKKHRNCHTSRKGAKGQIAAIEAEGLEREDDMKTTLSELRHLIREVIEEAKSAKKKSVKRKVDQDGDGDNDFADAKIAQYMRGGMPKGKAIAKSRKFNEGS